MSSRVAWSFAQACRMSWPQCWAVCCSRYNDDYALSDCCTDACAITNANTCAADTQTYAGADTAAGDKSADKAADIPTNSFPNSVPHA